jgi:MoaA/NifB/PqqE/SkfB family radical SAM enzyme
MEHGIPARLKGIETGYELDSTGNCGKDCKVCNKWLTPKEGGLLTEEEKKKVEALKKRKPITITLN